MKIKTLALLAATCLHFGVAQADTTEAGEGQPATAPGPVDKAGNAVGHAAKATANGIERGANAAVRGVKRGATAAGRGIEHGAQATGRAAQKVGKKLGLSETADPQPTNTQDAKPLP